MPVGCGIHQGARNINMDPKKGKNYAAKFEVWTGLADESVKFQKKWFKRFFTPPPQNSLHLKWKRYFEYHKYLLRTVQNILTYLC